MSGALRWNRFGKCAGRGTLSPEADRGGVNFTPQTWLRSRIVSRAPGASVPPWLGGSLGLLPSTAHGSPPSLHTGWGMSTEQLLLTAAQASVHCQLPRCLRVTKVQEASWECVIFQRGVTRGVGGGRRGGQAGGSLNGWLAPSFSQFGQQHRWSCLRASPVAPSDSRKDPVQPGEKPRMFLRAVVLTLALVAVTGE